MQPQEFHLPLRPKLTEKDFAKISFYIQKNFGIKLPLSKLILVESRLIKRVIKLNIKNFADYVKYVFSKEGIEEQIELIDFICTNKTDFFREDHHFKFLEKQILMQRQLRTVNFWSAACSSGEEPYTIAMTLEELKPQGFNCLYNILATDISSSILKKAAHGEYQQDKVLTIPKSLQKKYFNTIGNIATIDPQLKKAIVFQKFNLIDDLNYSILTKKFDYIFCRNVLIYFDQATQTKVVESLIKQLAPGGILFLGHSETLLGRNLNLIQLQPTIYQKPHA
jgi:chemotaxis protein methyltransferase CheR